MNKKNITIAILSVLVLFMGLYIWQQKHHSSVALSQTSQAAAGLMQSANLPPDLQTCLDLGQQARYQDSLGNKTGVAQLWQQWVAVGCNP